VGHLPHPDPVRARARLFAASNLTIQNAFDGLAEMTKPGGLHSHDGGGPQAVALMLDKGSDRARLTEVDILSYQDTLFPDAGSSLFERCLITGSYDFIFGAGRAYFQDCEIRSRPGRSIRSTATSSRPARRSASPSASCSRAAG
jgi:pectinesterase